MPRPKGYKLSEEAKKRIGDASRRKWEEKRSKPHDFVDVETKPVEKKWWRFWE